MSSDQGKLFIGGISWETTEEKLKEYFEAFGELSEAVIMKDRATGRARGFGFIVFKDPSVADVVVLQKHSLDGRMVEAKKAVPREEQHNVNRNINGSGSSLVPSKTKKIFVGGLASTCTENDFRMYFGQFGTITDVVVMYDHGTQRPRGFGFITYDSEDAVDRVLQTTFHKLNDKMVEVKRAVPKDLSVGSNRNNVGLNATAGRSGIYGLGYGHPYSSSPLPSYGLGMDARFISSPSSRVAFSSYGTMVYPDYSGSNDSKQGFSTYGSSGTYRTSSYGGFSGINVGYGRLGDNNSINYGSPGRSGWSTGESSFGSIGSSGGIGASAGFNLNSQNVAGTWNSSPSLGSNSSVYASHIYGGYGGADFVSSTTTPVYGRQNADRESSSGSLSGNRWGSGSRTLFGDLYGSSGYSDSTWRMTPTDALNYARAGSGEFRTDAFGSNSIIGSEDDLSIADGAYGGSGRQSFRGVPV